MTRLISTPRCRDGFARALKVTLAAAAVAVSAGCAHPIAVTPDINKLERNSSADPLNKGVAYYIADDDRNKEFTSPGGGGDKVSYFAYRDIESGLYKILTNVFGNVTKLKKPDDSEALRTNKVSYVIKPSIVTNSSSPSPFTWPPTRFSVDMTCEVTDTLGKLIVTKSVSGQGHAEFDEFKKDVSLSAKRAAEDALLKMQRALLDAPELRR